MATSKHRTIRGKMVKQDGLLLDVHQDGGIHIKVDSGPGSEQARLDLTEEQAVLLNGLLDDMIEWVPDEPAEISSP